MSSPPQSLAEIRDIIDDDYIIVVDACRDDELGRVCKAFDKQSRSRSRYVALLRLHQWCQHLPVEVQERLLDAVQAAQVPLPNNRDDNKTVTCCAINCVVSYKLFGQRSKEKNREQKETKSELLDFIVSEWVDEVSIVELFRNYLKTPSEVLTFIYNLSDQLGKIYTQSKHLRPEISLDKLRVKEEYEGVDGIVLGGWSFDRALDEEPRTIAQQQEDADRLVRLLLQCLDALHEQKQGKNLHKWDRNNPNISLETIKDKYSETDEEPNAKAFWHTLVALQNRTSAQYSARNPQNLALHLEKYSDIGKDLDKALDGRTIASAASLSVGTQAAGSRPVQSGVTSSANQAPTETDSQGDNLAFGADTSGVNSDNTAGNGAQLSPDIAQPDMLEVKVLGMGVTAEQALWARKPGKDDATDSKIAQLGAAPIWDQTIRRRQFGDAPVDPEKIPEDLLLTDKFEWLRKLREHRVYIQRHVFKIDDLPYYTISDLGYEIPDRRTVVDGVRVSPLFAVLLKPDSVIEVDERYRISLQAASEEQIGWALASTPEIDVLRSRESHFTPLPTDRELVISLTIFNPTNEVDRLTIVADGMPIDWPLPMPTPVSVFDQSTEETTFAIPLPPFRLQGDYAITLRLISNNVDAQVTTKQIHVHIAPQFDYTGQIVPEAIRAGNVGEIEIQNRGNLHQDFVVSLRDREGALTFTPAEVTVGVQPHQQGAIGYRASQRKWRLLGRTKQHEVNASVTPLMGGVPQTIHGQVISRPLIPAWVPLLLGLLLLGVFLVYTFILVPDFIHRTVTADDIEIQSLVAGQDANISWQAANSCFYSVYKNGSLFKTLAWHGAARDPVKVSQTVAGDQFEVLLRGCTFLRAKTWSLEVAVGPTPTPEPATAPQQLDFNVTIDNAETSGLGIGGPNANDGQTYSPQRDILLGQTGDLCFTWGLDSYDEEAFTLRLWASQNFALWPGQMQELQGKEGVICLPIAQSFDVAGDYFFKFKLHDKVRDIEPEYYEQLVKVSRPRCQVNTGVTLLVREGPGRNFAPRGELLPQTEVFPLYRPFVPGETQPPEPWVAVTLAADPRPAWIAYGYLHCPVSIDPLPAAMQIPATPTPTPTLTPEPTATPIPVIEPVVAVEPEIINLGGCAKITWAIVNVLEVYLNGEGVIGESEREVCPETAGEYEYKWRIVDLDGENSELVEMLKVNPDGSGGPLPPPTN